MKYLLYISLLLVFVAALLYMVFLKNGNSIFESQKIKMASDFDKCAELGFPVMESYPRKCRAGNKEFVEEVKFMQYKDLIRVNSPLPGEKIHSPLVIRGEARGSWFFEASFPAKLLDGNGIEIAQIPVQATGDWMKSDYVPFQITLSFIKPNTATGTLILKKDNPSGLPEKDDEVIIPIKF